MFVKLEKIKEEAAMACFKVVLAFIWRNWGKPWETSQDSRCPGQDSNWAGTFHVEVRSFKLRLYGLWPHIMLW